MTQLGPDLASYQAGIDLATLTDASFVTAKCTEGAGYVDPPYAGWLAQAKSLGRLFVWYHFLTQSDSAEAQAANTVGNVGDPTLPGMVDIETEGSSKPALTDVCAYIDACHAAGLRIKLAYLPQWYWEQVLGSPDLTPLTERGVAVVSSAFAGSTGTGPAQYQADGGDQGPGWAAYGGVTPLLWQFTDHAAEGGQSVDYNAYRGTLAELAAYLAEPVPTTAPTSGPTTGTGTSAGPAGPRVLTLGCTGADVKAVQQDLVAHAYSVTDDGDFGAVTETRVRQFQHDHGLSVDGCVGAQTLAALTLAPQTTPYPGLASVRLGASGAVVRTLQEGLARCGFPPAGGVDGVYGQDTNTQVGAFQAARGLTEDYAVGPSTWSAATTI